MRLHNRRQRIARGRRTGTRFELFIPYPKSQAKGQEVDHKNELVLLLVEVSHCIEDRHRTDNRRVRRTHGRRDGKLLNAPDPFVTDDSVTPSRRRKGSKSA